MPESDEKESSRVASVHEEHEARMRLATTVGISGLITLTGWVLVFSALCVRCSTERRHRFDSDYAPGATANAAESTLVATEHGATSLLLLGLGGLILILNRKR